MITSPQVLFPKALELWGGAECSITRVRGRIEDQLHRTGCDSRTDDLERVASLGMRALRLPVLWERHQTQPNAWEDTDYKINRLRELGIRPIIGLLHHGCGPTHEGLADPDFSSRFAEFAARVADRYPEVADFTPINEPLTTARFSGMYGIWHPYGRTTECFVRLFLNQCQAIRSAMKAIRQVNPAARLIQTEDIGKTYSLPDLRYQADLENERRWLTFDLLLGKLIPQSRVGRYLISHGISTTELESFQQDPCIPDLLGINYYVTSERFIDKRLWLYPQRNHGGNDFDNYADVTAVRVRAEGIAGHAGILREVWNRYSWPMALTEVQLACTREEQLRWLVEAWQACDQLRNEGVSIEALTAWSLFGAYDWDSLLVHAAGHYENGAFDVRGPTPRQTALAPALRALAKGVQPIHPVLSTPGWWKRDVRLLYPAVATTADGKPPRCNLTVSPDLRPVLLVGANGTLGQVFQKTCELRGLNFVALGRSELDVCDFSAITRMIERLNPWAVINASGYVKVDAAELEEQACFSINVKGPVNLARACAEAGVAFVTFSSDLVFDGQLGSPYTENHQPHPLNVYGRSKFEAEVRVNRVHPQSLIIRTSAFFGPWDDYNFVTVLLRRLQGGETVLVARDLIVSPTYLPDLVRHSLDLLIDGESGLWHLANDGAVSWSDWAIEVARLGGYSSKQIAPVASGELDYPAPRPLNSSLSSSRGALMGHWQDALTHYFAERNRQDLDYNEAITGGLDGVNEQSA